MCNFVYSACTTLLLIHSTLAFTFGNHEPQKDEGIVFSFQRAPRVEPFNYTHGEGRSGRMVAQAPAPGIYQVPNTGFPDYGEVSGSHGFESYMERAMRTWYNIARIGPIYFKNSWLVKFLRPGDVSSSQVFDSDKYTAVPKPPVHFNLNLARAARAHSVDRMGCSSSSGGSPHYDCNGTTANTRISKFIGSNSGEVLVIWPMTLTPKQWRNWPVYVIAAWICDGFGNGAMQIGQCCRDGGTTATSPLGCASGADGHRSTIMLVDGEVGCGYSITSDGKSSASTCNEYGKETGPYMGGSPIYDGAHLYSGDGVSYNYWATFYQPGAAVKSARVYVDGVPFVLSLKTGEAARGAYASTGLVETSPTEPCHCYFFEFKTATDTYRLPSKGVYFTDSVGACQTNYNADPRSCATLAPTSAGMTFSPTGAPTTRMPTAKPTTARPTTKAPTKFPTTKAPTNKPTTKAPTNKPTTRAPTAKPTTKVPTKSPTTRVPTQRPTTKAPTTKAPTKSPTTKAPTTKAPTLSPTKVAAANAVGNLSAGAAAAILVPLIVIAVALFLYVLFKYWLHKRRSTVPSLLEVEAREKELETLPAYLAPRPFHGPPPDDLPGTENYPDDLPNEMMG